MKKSNPHPFSPALFSLSHGSLHPSHSESLITATKYFLQNFFSFFDKIFADSKKRPTFALAIENNSGCLMHK